MSPIQHGSLPTAFLSSLPAVLILKLCCPYSVFTVLGHILVRLHLINWHHQISNNNLKTTAFSSCRLRSPRDK